MSSRELIVLIVLWGDRELSSNLIAFDVLVVRCIVVIMFYNSSLSGFRILIYRIGLNFVTFEI